MRIGLIDIDGHNFPNLALMKISAHHKRLGDIVNWYNPFESYDIVYKSKIFTFTQDYQNYINNALQVIEGGTGYNLINKIPNEQIQPDYSLYSINNTAYGFLTRGCIRKCAWCLVPQKEGNIKPYADIEEVAQDRKNVILMDNNILACDYGLSQIEKIAKMKIKVDFNQGLDARLITPSVADLLSKVKWIRYIRTSCDTITNLKYIEEMLNNMNNAGVKNYRIFVYVLLQNLTDAYYILNWLKDKGCRPFAQPFRDFTPNQIIPQWQKDMACWVNKGSEFNACDFKDYRPRKNFCCFEYFTNLESLMCVGKNN